MSERPWYKRFPSDFIAGTIGLTAEQKGVYSTLLDMMYDRGRALIDSPVDLARVCGCSTRRFNQIKLELAVDPKKIILRDGLITNKRFEEQKPAEVLEAEKLAQNARKSQEKRAENKTKKSKTKGLANQGREHYQSPDSRDREERTLALSGSVHDDWPEDFVDQFWNRFPPGRKYDQPKVEAKLIKIRASRKVTWAKMMAGLDRFIATNPDPEFTCAPLVWINGQRWNADYGTRGKTDGQHANGRRNPGDAILAAARGRAGQRGGNRNGGTGPSDHPAPAGGRADGAGPQADPRDAWILVEDHPPRPAGEDR